MPPFDLSIGLEQASKVAELYQLSSAVRPRKIKRVLPNQFTVAICGGEDRNAYRRYTWKFVSR